jgi:hypothetical protein
MLARMLTYEARMLRMQRMPPSELPLSVYTSTLAYHISRILDTSIVAAVSAPYADV